MGTPDLYLAWAKGWVTQYLELASKVKTVVWDLAYKSVESDTKCWN